MRRRLGPALAAAGAGLLLLVSPAWAASPANDGFADAENVGPSLPVDVSRTNAEATKETGEPSHGTLGSTGHSVWFEWEATSTGFVTVGTCGTEFATAVGVYTGTTVDALTQVAGDYPSLGPGCLSGQGQEVTFEALSGTSYAIAVDGNAYYLPPAEPPLGEGAVQLQLRWTPVPANDDFADAAQLSGSVFPEPGDTVGQYLATARGSNWNADKELDEPEHAGDPGGASVWYAWLAAGTGSASASVCGGKPVVLGVYTGAAVDDLTPVGTREYPCAVTFPAAVGQTYWIAVDGEFDEGSGEPALRSFDVFVGMELPLEGGGAPGGGQGASAPSSAPDTTAPDTVLGKRVLRAAQRSATFAFSSTEANSTFRCRLDGRKWGGCTSPKVYKNLEPGRHTFRVAAVDPTGNVDAAPALTRFQVAKPGRKPSR